MSEKIKNTKTEFDGKYITLYILNGILSNIVPIVIIWKYFPPHDIFSWVFAIIFFLIGGTIMFAIGAISLILIHNKKEKTNH